MKRGIIIPFLLFALSTKAQWSCSSPTGAMNSIPAPPPSYPWLQANGYCNPGVYGKNPTVCWTFTPASSSVTINSGWAASGCASISFCCFNLYTCTPSCTFIGSGLSFTGLTPGQCYTWCMTGIATGPPFCTFTDFCPYYINNFLLPLNIISFGCQDGFITFITTYEEDIQSYSIEYSETGDGWILYQEVQPEGPSVYRVASSGEGYYRIAYSDLNGATRSIGTVYCDYPNLSETVVVYYNLLGQNVSSQSAGMIIEVVSTKEGKILEKRFRYLKP